MASARKVYRFVDDARTVVKQLRVTLVGLGLRHVEAIVTLSRDAPRWSASATVEIEGRTIEHATSGHCSERDALVVIADWLRKRSGARTTCLGSTVTIVGVSASAVV